MVRSGTVTSVTFPPRRSRRDSPKRSQKTVRPTYGRFYGWIPGGGGARTFNPCQVFVTTVRVCVGIIYEHTPYHRVRAARIKFENRNPLTVAETTTPWRKGWVRLRGWTHSDAYVVYRDGGEFPPFSEAAPAFQGRRPIIPVQSLRTLPSRPLPDRGQNRTYTDRLTPPPPTTVTVRFSRLALRSGKVFSGRVKYMVPRYDHTFDNADGYECRAWIVRVNSKKKTDKY